MVRDGIFRKESDIRIWKHPEVTVIQEPKFFI